MTSIRSLRLPAVVAALGLMLGCGGGDGSLTGDGGAGGGGGGGSKGNLRIRITDSPFADAKAVLVTFTEVQVHLADADWQVVPFSGGTSRTCDLKKLQGAQDVLGVGALPAGHYTQIRLVVSAAALYFDSEAAGAACDAAIAAPAGASANLEIPSGEVKLNRQFELTGSGTTITLDFDGEKSIRKTGSGRYRMSPVIAVVSVS